MLTLKDLIHYCRAQAIADAIEPDELSVWRSACRTYSANFNTPLHEVEKIDPVKVFLHNFEKQLEDIDIEENIEHLLQQIYRIENPDYDKELEQETQKFIKLVESGKIKKKTSKKTLFKKEEQKIDNLPISGSVDFSHLKNEN